MSVDLRAFVSIDRMQAQTAAHIAATSQGDVPVAGMAELFVELAPGNDVFRVADVALKAADVRPALQIVEREFGLLEIHATSPAEVDAAGAAILDLLGLTAGDTRRPQIASLQIITKIHPYQAQLLNKWRQGSLLIAGASLLVLEVAPAAWISLAVNEAEKHADISVIEIRSVGRFGRMFVAGAESEVASARDAAVAALEQVKGRDA